MTRRPVKIRMKCVAVVFATMFVLAGLTALFAVGDAAAGKPVCNPKKPPGCPPPPTPPVTISGVNFPQRNSYNGDKVEMKWSVSPSDATDTVTYGPDTGYAYTASKINGQRDTIISLKDAAGNRIISPHQTIYVRIVASKSGYTTGVWTGTTYATIFNPSRSYETRTITSSYDNCGARVVWDFYAEGPGNLAYNPAKTGDPNSKQVTDLGVHFAARSQGGCIGNTIQVRDLSIDVYALDSASNADWIAAKNAWITTGYANPATVSYGVTVGFEGGGSVATGSFQFTALYTAPSAPAFPKNVVNSGVCTQWGDGRYLGNYGVNWPAQASFLELYGAMPLYISDSLAALRLYDKVTFVFHVTVYYDLYWFWGWRGNQGLTDGFDIILGNGDIDYTNTWDVFTSVQSGWMAGIE